MTIAKQPQPSQYAYCEYMIEPNMRYFYASGALHQSMAGSL